MKIKHATVIKEYTADCQGETFTVPVGARVCNQTAMGPDDNYRFWSDFRETVKEVHCMTYHDLIHYGINVPKDHCTDWDIT